MPSLNRRRENDLRAGRLESEIRIPEREAALRKLDSRKGLLHCKNCGGTFEEESTVCPRCDRKDGIGHIKRIPRDLLEQAKNNAIRRSRARLGL